MSLINQTLLLQRKSKLSKLGINSEILPSPLQSFILADFLKLLNPRKKLLAVNHSFNILLKAAEILPFLPRPCHLKWFEGVDGFVDLDIGGAKEIVMKEVKRRVMMKMVLSSFWPKISNLLQGPLSAEVCNLLQVPLLSPVPVAPQHESIPSIVAAAKSIQSSVYDSVVTRISIEFPEVNLDLFKSAKYTTLSSRLHFYPNHPLHQFEEVYKLFLDDLFGPKDILSRKNLLTSTMKAYSPPVIYRQDSRFANEFINSDTLASVHEVVAILALTRDLFAFSHVAWSNLRIKYEKEMEDFVFKEGMQWSEAYQRLVRSREFQDDCKMIVKGRKRKAVELGDGVDEWEEW